MDETLENIGKLFADAYLQYGYVNSNDPFFKKNGLVEGVDKLVSFFLSAKLGEIHTNISEKEAYSIGMMKLDKVTAYFSYIEDKILLMIFNNSNVNHGKIMAQFKVAVHNLSA
ncbi:MAG: hypothetical protein OEY56_14365 [Cyclobacteriaceae bacterium]|nr:hypothetical protein [Cyclobacteriaceae bacterium]